MQTGVAELMQTDPDTAYLHKKKLPDYTSSDSLWFSSESMYYLTIYLLFISVLSHFLPRDAIACAVRHKDIQHAMLYNKPCFRLRAADSVIYIC